MKRILEKELDDFVTGERERNDEDDDDSRGSGTSNVSHQQCRKTSSLGGCISCSNQSKAYDGEEFHICKIRDSVRRFVEVKVVRLIGCSRIPMYSALIPLL